VLALVLCPAVRGSRNDPGRQKVLLRDDPLLPVAPCDRQPTVVPGVEHADDVDGARIGSVVPRADGDATTDVGGGDGDGKPCTHVWSFRDGHRGCAQGAAVTGSRRKSLG